MEVYLKNIEVNVPAKDYVASCQNAAEFGDLIAEVGNRIMEMDEAGRRLLVNSIPQEMSINGRAFIESLYGAILQFDKQDVE